MDTKDVISPYSVRAGTFEGPLDLLLSLIEDRKFFINEISLAEVTNDYISFLKSLNETSDEKHIEGVSYFVLIASTLILIKSKSLLPNLSITEEEKEDITDLEKRLKIYQVFKIAGIGINKQFGQNIIFSPTERVWSDPLFSPDPLITKENILLSISNAISNAPKKEAKLPEIEVRKVINIEEVINNLTDRIKDAVKLSFRDFTKGDGNRDKEEAKTHVIISFLAMLELVREGIINVIQSSSFGDIEINKNEGEVEGELISS
ncbi:MAG: hypothetical protein EOM85_00430 [Candidatus Moranbacteria bacterium]|nr:hypothetical protein [Candidatus Moranbacteria bacterium]